MFFFWRILLPNSSFKRLIFTLLEQLNTNLQYCAKVMQVNFDKIPAFLGFSKKFGVKQYFKEISLHFCDAYCSHPHKFSHDNSRWVIIHHKFSSDNFVPPEIKAVYRCKFIYRSGDMLKQPDEKPIDPEEAC